MELDKAVARVIRQARVKCGITQRELGYRTGLDPMTISRIERGVRLPSLMTLFIMAEAMQTSVQGWIEEIELLEPHITIAEPNRDYGMPKKRGKRSSG
jgi:transcriptional regulator with XRE-family HTH domain